MSRDQAQSPARKRNIGFVELTDEALDIFSHYTQATDWDVVLVVSQYPDSYPVRMAEILQIPMLETPNRLALLTCDRVIVGDRPVSVLAAVTEQLGGTEVEVVPLDQALKELKIERHVEPETPGIGANLKLSPIDDGLWDWEEITLGKDADGEVSETREVPAAAPDASLVVTEAVDDVDETETETESPAPTDEMGPVSEEALRAVAFVAPEDDETVDDGAVEITSEDEETVDDGAVEITSENEETTDSVNEIEEPAELAAGQDEPVEVSVGDDEPVEVSVGDDEPVEVSAEDDEPAETVADEILAVAETEPEAAPPAVEEPAPEAPVETAAEADEVPEEAPATAEATSKAAPVAAVSGDRVPEERASSGRTRFDTTTLLGSDINNKVGPLPFHDEEMKALRKILLLAVRATHAQTGSIMLLDEDGEHLRIAVAEGLPDDIVTRGRRHKSEGVAGAVFTEAAPRIVRGRLPGSVDPAIRPALREAACVPIMSDGRAIGTLNVNMETEGDPIGEKVIPLLTRFAKEASAAILKAIDISGLDKSKRLDALLRQVDRLMALNDSLPGRLHTVADALGNALLADFVHFLVVDPLGRRLELRTPPRGVTSWQTRSQPMDQGFLGLVIREGTPQILEIQGGEDALRAAMICFPVATSRPHGLIVLENAVLDGVSRDEAMDLLSETIAHVESIIEVELGVEAQELLYQLQMRVADQMPQLVGLPPVQRTRGALEFCVDLLAGEVAIWVPKHGARPITSQPHSPRATQLLTQARGSLDLLAEWVQDQGSVAGGTEARGWNPKAPRGPAPYVGVTSGDEEGVLLLFFSPEETVGSPAQVEPHALMDIMVRVSEFCSPIFEPQNVQPVAHDRSVVPDPEKTFTVKDLKTLIHQEWIRSRRYGHAFGLTRFRISNPTEGTDDPALREFLIQKKRDVDLLTEVRPGAYVLLSPEVGHAPSGIVRRLIRLWEQDHESGTLDVDQRVFPRDGQAEEAYLNWADMEAGAEEAA